MTDALGLGIDIGYRCFGTWNRYVTEAKGFGIDRLPMLLDLE